MASEKIIYKSVSGYDGNNIEYREIISVSDHKLRVFIRANSYDFQSSAKIEVFSNTDKKWNFVEDLYHTEIESLRNDVRNSSKQAKPVQFAEDRDKLVAIAVGVLDIEAA